MRHIMSCVEYGQLRMLLSVVNVDLPHWNGLRLGRLRIRRLLKIDIDFRESVLQNECYVINLKQMISHVSSWIFQLRGPSNTFFPPQKIYGRTEVMENLYRNWPTHLFIHIWIFILFSVGGKMCSKCLKASSGVKTYPQTYVCRWLIAVTSTGISLNL